LPKQNIKTRELIDGILSGNRTLLSRAITLIESSKKEHQLEAEKIIEACLPHAGNSFRIGITGVPGVGKSTFIESFGNLLIEKGHKIAVLAIDPSSSRSKGSILGDKTRMETLAGKDEAFIRPSPTSGSLGGVARSTRETIILFEAAGFDYILIETVGVGQSETAVHSMVDFFLLLMLAGAGDELQGIKRGIMEMADAILINKADGDNLAASKRAQAEYKSALHLFPATESGWIPEVHLISSTEHTGREVVYEMLNRYLNQAKISGYFDKKRADQAQYWLKESIEQDLLDDFFRNPDVMEKLPEFRDKVRSGELHTYTAARLLLQNYKESKRD
jgi:LAO/AO transport system kinase